MGWFKNDQLAPYKSPDGTRTGAGGFEKGPREFVLQYLQKPAYTATGQRGFLCAWVGYKRRTVEPLSELEQDIPRILRLWYLKHPNLAWNDAARTVTW